MEVSVNASNRGGWQSRNDLHERGIESVEALVQDVKEATKQFFEMGLLALLPSILILVFQARFAGLWIWIFRCL